MRSTVKISAFLIIIFSALLYSQEKDFTALARWGNGVSNCVVVNNNTAYTGNGAYVSLIDISAPESPIEISSVLLPATVQGIFVSGNYAYVADGFGGAFIVDVSDQNNPTVTGSFETENYFCNRWFNVSCKRRRRFANCRYFKSGVSV